MKKNDDFRKLLKERLDQADEDIYCSKIAIAELFIKNHKISTTEGIGLLDYSETSSDWDEIVELLVSYECANSVKDEISLLLHLLEHKSDSPEEKFIPKNKY